MNSRTARSQGAVALLVAAVFSLSLLGCGEPPPGGSVGTEEGAGHFYGDYVVMALWAAPEPGDEKARQHGAKAAATQRAEGKNLLISLTETSVALTSDSPMEGKSLMLGYTAQGTPEVLQAKLIMSLKAPLKEHAPEMDRLEVTEDGEGRLLFVLVPRSEESESLFHVVRRVSDPRIGEEDKAILAQTPSEIRVEAAEAQMVKFAEAIDTYRSFNKKLPTSLEDLMETGGRIPNALIDKIPLDPWGYEYVYRIFGRLTYELRSYGEDKLADTDDDVVWARE